MIQEPADRYGQVPVTPETVETTIEIHGFRGTLSPSEATELKAIITKSGAEAAKTAMVATIGKHIDEEDARNSAKPE